MFSGVWDGRICLGPNTHHCARRLSDLEASGLLDQCIRPCGRGVAVVCGSFLLLHNEEDTKIKLPSGNLT